MDEKKAEEVQPAQAPQPQEFEGETPEELWEEAEEAADKQ